MVQRIDYEIGEDWDIKFTEWDDFKVVRGNRVLTQNFILLASKYSKEMLGKQLTTTDISRHKSRLERDFTSIESVSYFSIDNVEINEDELLYTLTIGSDEYTVPVYI